MPTAQELVNMGYYGYQGWGDAEANADFQATGGAGKGGPSGGGAVLGASTDLGSPELLQLARGVLELQKEFAQPAVSTLEGAIGDVNEQYNKLLETFKPQAETTRSRELGRRGVPLSSTSAQESIQKAGQDVSTQIEANRAAQITPLQTAIANLQSGGNVGNVLGNAMELMQFQQQLPLMEKQLELQNRQLDYDLSNVGNTGSGGGGGGYLFDPAAFASGFNSSGIQQQTTGQTSSTSTSNLSPTELFKQRVLSGQYLTDPIQFSA